jgi:hypothetical protein
VTVSVLEWKHIVALRERIKVGVIFEVFLRHVTVKRLSSSLTSEKKDSRSIAHASHASFRNRLPEIV